MSANHFSAISTLILLTILSCIVVGCCQQIPSAPPKSETKSNASADGLDKAMHDIEALKVELQAMSLDQLIAAFIPDGPKRYGGYEYYYNDMANRVIRDELHVRGDEALPILKKHSNDSMRLWQRTGGPGRYTIGSVCRELIEQINANSTSISAQTHSNPQQ